MELVEIGRAARLLGDASAEPFLGAILPPACGGLRGGIDCPLFVSDRFFLRGVSSPSDL